MLLVLMLGSSSPRGPMTITYWSALAQDRVSRRRLCMAYNRCGAPLGWACVCLGRSGVFSVFFVQPLRRNAIQGLVGFARLLGLCSLLHPAWPRLAQLAVGAVLHVSTLCMPGQLGLFGARVGAGAGPANSFAKRVCLPMRRRHLCADASVFPLQGAHSLPTCVSLFRVISLPSSAFQAEGVQPCSSYAERVPRRKQIRVLVGALPLTSCLCARAARRNEPNWRMCRCTRWLFGVGGAAHLVKGLMWQCNVG